jgi:uncharacterized membrane protein YphA (DoxX/SURF4 family)
MVHLRTSVEWIGRLFFNPYISLINRLVLGGVFIFAGTAKLPYIGNLIWQINQYHILPRSMATAYGYVLPPLEIALGAFLILGIFIRASALISALVLLTFVISNSAALARGLDIETCGCFGPAVPLLSVHSLAIDFVLLALAIQIIFHRGEFLSLGCWLSPKIKSRHGPSE